MARQKLGVGPGMVQAGLVDLMACVGPDNRPGALPCWAGQLA